MTHWKQVLFIGGSETQRILTRTKFDAKKDHDEFYKFFLGTLFSLSILKAYSK